MFSALIDDMATHFLCQFRGKIVSACEKCVLMNTECIFAIISCSTCLSWYCHEFCKNILCEQGYIKGFCTE